jgi:hypothetical protein
MVGQAGKPSGMRLKASSFRSFVRILEKQGRRDSVTAIVPPETAVLISDPPLPGSWMDLKHSLHIMQAVETIWGMSAVRDLARKGTDDARKPYMGIVEGVLRLFGTSPATLFKRMNSLVGSFVQGVDYRYTPLSDRSGVMVLEYKACFEVPICFFVGQMPVFQTLLEACGAKGVVSEPERLSPSAASFRIEW